MYLVVVRAFTGSAGLGSIELAAWASHSGDRRTGGSRFGETRDDSGLGAQCVLERALIHEAKLHGVADDLAEAVRRRNARGSRDQRFPFRSTLRLDSTVADQALQLVSFELSPRGVGGVIERFQHPGSSFATALITLHGSWTPVTGTIDQCQYVTGTGSVYRVEFGLDCEIDLSAHVREAVRPRVLLLQSSKIVSEVVCDILDAVAECVKVVETSAQACDELVQQHFDTLIADGPEGCAQLGTLMKELRNAFFNCQVIRVGSTTCKCASCGVCDFDDILTFPIDPEQLITMVRAAVPEPIISERRDDPSLAKMVATFPDKLRTQLDEIMKSHHGRPPEEIRPILREIRIESELLGYSSLHDAFLETEVLVQRAQSADDVRNAIVRILKLARLVR